MIINFLDKSTIIKIVETILLSNIKILGSFMPVSIGEIEREEKLKKKILLYLISLITISIRFSFLTALQFLTAVGIIFISNRIKDTIKINSNKILPIIIFSSIFINDIIWSLFDKILVYDFIIATIKSILSVLIYLIMENVNLSLKDNEEKDMLANVTFAGILLMGIGEFSLFSLNIKDIVSIVIVLIISLSNGVKYSALSGVILGAMSELSDPNMGIGIVALGLGGLLSGLFKNKGKIYIIWGFVFGNSILAYYLSGYNTLVNHFLEILIASSIFYVLTTKEINRFKIVEEAPKNLLYEGSLSNETINELDKTSGTLYSISELIDDMEIDEEKYDLFDEIKEEICLNCEKYDECWDKNYDETMDTIFDSIELLDEGEEKEAESILMTDDCDKGKEILNKIKYRYSEYKSENIKYKNNEIRNCVAEQFKGFSQYITDIKQKFTEDNLDSLEKKIVNGFEKENYELEKVDVNISNEKCEVALKTNGQPHKISFLLAANEILSKVLKRRMLASDEEKELVVFKEYDKLHVDCYATTKKADNSTTAGDSYKIVNSENDKFMMLLSDGMGTGIEANKISNSLVELFSEMSRIGLNPGIVTNMLGSFIQYISNTEKIVTLDTMSIDLLTGECELLKIGGAPTFIIRKNNVEIIYCDSLPLGILDRVDFLEEKRLLEVGDIVVSVSDGVVDSKRDLVNKEYWVSSFLKKIEVDEPEIIAQELLAKTISNYNNEIKDDITIVVSKICE